MQASAPSDQYLCAFICCVLLIVIFCSYSEQFFYFSITCWSLEKLEEVLDPKVIQLVGEDGAPMPVQSNVDGAKLAAFIDAAVADSIKELEKRDDDLSKAGVTMLENVDGKSMVKQMSPQFLEFVLDAYRSLRWARS